MTGANRSFPEHRGQRREPAEAHFRRMGETGSAAGIPDILGAARGRFEVYRTDEVRMTSIHFAGGDWHWRLCDEAGQVLVDAGGYRNEPDCRAAVALLKDRAAQATVCAASA
jgi:uncharacterized protein YegP (UPF0339 family)